MLRAVEQRGGRGVLLPGVSGYGTGGSLLCCTSAGAGATVSSGGLLKGGLDALGVPWDTQQRCPASAAPETEVVNCSLKWLCWLCARAVKG